MTFDATIHAEYSDINTVRQSQEKRGERSLVLVEGSFDTTDELMLHEVDDAPDTPARWWRRGAWSCPPTPATRCAICRRRRRTTPCCGSGPTQAGSRPTQAWTAAIDLHRPAGTTAFAAVQMPASKVPLLAAACGAAAALLLVILFIARKRKSEKQKAAEKAK